MVYISFEREIGYLECWDKKKRLHIRCILKERASIDVCFLTSI
jgi:hypothetical protein